MSPGADAAGGSPGPVFIVGGSRTGSEMLKTMLCCGPEQDFVDELFLLCPRWLHPDLATNIERHVGDLAAPGALERLIEFLFSGRPYGWLWSKAGEQLDRDRLHEALRDQPLDLRTILDAVMRTHAQMRGKRRHGAKFPTHYSATRRLLDWFPDCRLLHTTREPKAVYASQSAKYIEAGDSTWRRGVMRCKQFVHINLQVSWTARLHRQLEGRDNYRLVRYEDVVTNPEGELRSICEFLALEYTPEMLQPNRYGSSFGKTPGEFGVGSDALERWRGKISPVTAGLIDLLHPLARARFGYEDDV